MGYILLSGVYIPSIRVFPIAWDLAIFPPCWQKEKIARSHLGFRAVMRRDSCDDFGAV